MSKETKKDDSKKEDQPQAGEVPPRRNRRLEDVHAASGTSHIWLVSFTDVMALMLTFFVLLFSMTEPSKQDWSEISMALKTEFNRFYGASNFRGTEDSISLDKINFNRALDLPYLEALIEAEVKENEALAGTRIFQMQGSLIISMPQELLFEVGDAEVKGEGAKALYNMGGMLSRIKNKIEVTGHADPRPIEDGDSAYDSNWSLSLARAASVAGLLNSVGYQRPITIRGHSSGRYEDLESIQDEDERMALSRRVDIVLMDHDGSRQKLFFNTGGQ